MKAINEKEFKALIKLYEAITLEQLKQEERESDPDYKTGLTRITGFGNTQYCTLCKATRKSNPNQRKVCELCVYGIIEPDILNVCIECDNTKSYDAIYNANSLEELLAAIQDRATHMRIIWKQYLKKRK